MSCQNTSLKSRLQYTPNVCESSQWAACSTTVGWRWGWRWRGLRRAWRRGAKSWGTLPSWRTQRGKCVCYSNHPHLYIHREGKTTSLQIFLDRQGHVRSVEVSHCPISLLPRAHSSLPPLLWMHPSRRPTVLSTQPAQGAPQKRWPSAVTQRGGAAVSDELHDSPPVRCRSVFAEAPQTVTTELPMWVSGE